MLRYFRKKQFCNPLEDFILLRPKWIFLAPYCQTPSAYNFDRVCTVRFVEFYFICPTNAQNILKICFLKHCYIFRCIYIILRESLIMFTKATKLIKWKHIYRRLLQKISRRFKAFNLLIFCNNRLYNFHFIIFIILAYVIRYCLRMMYSVALVRERTIPTERPPPVGEVSANFCG